MEKIELHGKKLSEADKKDAKEFIAYEHRRAKEPISGEYRKTKEDLEIILALNEYIQEEIRALGLEEVEAVAPSQIHLFSRDTYKEHFPNLDVSAFHEAFNRTINVDADDVEKSGKLQFIRDLLHEMVHIVSKTKYYLSENDIKVTRSGYRNVNPTEGHEHFLALNEAVVEKIVIDILERHRLDLVHNFDVSLEDYAKEGKYFSNYNEYIKVLEDIVNEISEKKGENTDDVWKRFKLGIFTGEMMHLRDINKIYGSNGLKIMDMLGKR